VDVRLTKISYEQKSGIGNTGKIFPSPRPVNVSAVTQSQLLRVRLRQRQLSRLTPYLNVYAVLRRNISEGKREFPAKAQRRKGKHASFFFASLRLCASNFFES
jgi:hypothetical protein